MKKVGLYLVGRITDLPDKGKTWREEYFNKISYELKNIEYIGPEIENQNDAYDQDVVRRDIVSIERSDMIIMNATIPFVFGGPMELILAKYFNKPVITILDKDMPFYRKYNEHPWLNLFSDFKVHSISEAIEIIRRYQEEDQGIRIKFWENIINGENFRM